MEEKQQFSKEQLEAIRHEKGPMLVLAGPGSGKTTVITHRVKYMLEHGRVNGSQILVITFTKAAAGEMKSRFEKIMGYSSGVTFGTFHSVFFMIYVKPMDIMEAISYWNRRNIRSFAVLLKNIIWNTMDRMILQKM